MYGTDSGDVNYVKFINDTQPNYFGHFTGEKADPSANKYGGARNRGLQDFSLLLDKIRKEVMVNRIRVKEYFMDFDPLRQGFIQFNKFRGVLSKMK